MSWEQVKRATVAIAAAEDGIIRGTGFFVSSDGYLLTCAHVVEALKRPDRWGKPR
ncbi:hypothetical protein [Coleofasciculus sp.]|uniref:hypothetical protein n=1 Tax=Coleofasciculus sp. TaxID=3100458 RepID=UPI003A26D713